MSWIKVNKSTFKAYCKKKGRDFFKVIVEDKFDGMVDCVVPVNKTGMAYEKQLLDYGRYIIYDTEKQKLRAVSISVGSYTLTDDLFKDLEDSCRKKEVLNKLSD